MTVPADFFIALVWAAISLSAAGGVVLVVLLIRDWKRGTLW
jgi:hypothetical protein